MTAEHSTRLRWSGTAVHATKLGNTHHGRLRWEILPIPQRQTIQCPNQPSSAQQRQRARRPRSTLARNSSRVRLRDNSPTCCTAPQSGYPFAHSNEKATLMDQVWTTGSLRHHYHLYYPHLHSFSDVRHSHQLNLEKEITHSVKKFPLLLRPQDEILYFRYDIRSPLRLVVLLLAANELQFCQSKTEKSARRRFWGHHIKWDLIIASNNWAKNKTLFTNLISGKSWQKRPSEIACDKGHAGVRF